MVDDGGGRLTCRVGWHGAPALAPSKLGFTLEQNNSIRPSMWIVVVHRREGANRSSLPIGSRPDIDDRYRGAAIDLAEPGATGRRSTLVMRNAYPKPGGGRAEGFDFIQNEPTSWDETRVLSGAPGESIVTARSKEAAWYLRAVTDAARTITMPLDPPGAGAHSARIWADGATPTSLAILERAVSRDDTLTQHRSQAASAAVRIGLGR